MKTRATRMRTALMGFFTLSLLCAAPARAAGDFELTIRDHRFEPEQVELPAGKRVTLTVTNADTTPEEFESRDLHIEKIVPGGQSVKIHLGPLQPGTYGFFGDMHPDSAKGAIVVK